MAIPSEYAYLLETVDFLWRNTQIYAIASGKSMRYYSSSYNICYQPANECSFLSYNEQSSSFQNAKMIATTVGSIRITDNGGTISVSYDDFKLNFWSEYNQKWIEWIEPDGTYGDYLEVPHTGSWKTSQTVDFRNFQTSFNSLSDACNYIYCNFKHCYIYYNNELWVNPNPPEPITSNGGGATHVAKVTGQLKDLSSNLSDILMVSGGGGGGLLVGDTDYSGKEAGGISGSGDNSADQSTGNAFGLGESGTNVSGGGSGLYGGYKGTSAKSGGAGSGYIGNSLLSNKKMVGYNVPTSSAESTKTESINEVSASAVSGKPKSGNGFARVKFLEEIYTDGKIIAVSTKTPNAWVSVSDNDDTDYVCVADKNGNELQAIQLSNALLLDIPFEQDVNAYLVQFDNLENNVKYKFYLRHGNTKSIRIERQVLSRTILFNHSNLKTHANNNSSRFVFSAQSPSYVGNFISFTINDSYLSWNGTDESYTNTNMSSSQRMIVNVPNGASRMVVLTQFKRTDSALFDLYGGINIEPGTSSYSRLYLLQYRAKITKNQTITMVNILDFDSLEIDKSSVANIAIRLNLYDLNHNHSTFSAEMSGMQVWAE